MSYIRANLTYLKKHMNRQTNNNMIIGAGADTSVCPALLIPLLYYERTGTNLRDKTAVPIPHRALCHVGRLLKTVCVCRVNDAAAEHSQVADMHMFSGGLGADANYYYGGEQDGQVQRRQKGR